MSPQYIVKNLGMVSDVWAILDCEKDEYMKHERLNRFGCMEEGIWRFNHPESAQYQADKLNAKEPSDEVC